MTWFKIDFNDVFFNGLTTAEVGCVIKYKCACQQFEVDSLDEKRLKSIFTSRELKFVRKHFGLCSKNDESLSGVCPEFVQSLSEVGSEFVQSSSKVCSKKSSKNNDLPIIYNNINNIPQEREKERKKDIITNSDELVVKREAFDLSAINSVLKKFKLPEVKKLTDARKTKLSARVKDCGGFEEFLGQMEAALANSSFLRGDSSKGWRSDFDFFLQPSSWQKAVEGSYADKQPQCGEVYDFGDYL